MKKMPQVILIPLALIWMGLFLIFCERKSNVLHSPNWDDWVSKKR